MSCVGLESERGACLQPATTLHAGLESEWGVSLTSDHAPCRSSRWRMGGMCVSDR